MIYGESPNGVSQELEIEASASPNHPDDPCVMLTIREGKTLHAIRVPVVALRAELDRIDSPRRR